MTLKLKNNYYFSKGVIIKITTTTIILPVLLILSGRCVSSFTSNVNIINKNHNIDHIIKSQKTGLVADKLFTIPKLSLLLLHESVSSSSSSLSSSPLSSKKNNSEQLKEEEELISKLETSVYNNLLRGQRDVGSLNLLLEQQKEGDDDDDEARMIISLGKLKEEINTKSRIILLSKAAITGIIAGLGVSAFKLSIDEVRQITYGSRYLLIENNLPLFLIPTLGGLAVSIISVLSKGDTFPPGLTGVIKEVDLEVETFYSSNSSSAYKIKTKIKDLVRIYQKMLAAIITLGTGCSLGPEGPSVEVGIAASRLLMSISNDTYTELYDYNDDGSNEEQILNKLDNLVQTKQKTCLAIQRQRVLLACGAAAGVSSGFNAPISAVFFALEIVQASLPPLSYYIVSPSKSTTSSASTSLESIMEQQSLSSKTSITAIVLSSVLSSLISHQLIGNELALQISGDYSVETPIFELPLYLILGALSGLVASLFNVACKFSNDVFGNRTTQIPNFYKPIFGGFACGIIGIIFPQILFFGYDTLNSLFQNTVLPLDLLIALLFVKIFATALSAGSGLVGGTFAPSLFMGAILGASFHEVVISILNIIESASSNHHLFTIANIHSYSIVGAACVLAAMFRAPLTASLLLFELTRDYEAIIPLMASAGIASLIGIYFNDVFEQRLAVRYEEDLILMVGDKQPVTVGNEGE